MRTWDTFFPDVLPEVLGCPEPSVENALRHAARRLCELSRVWRADLDPVTTAGATFELPLPREAAIYELVGATLNGEDIALDVADGTSTGNRQAERGRRRLLTWDKRTVQCIPTPADGSIVVVTAILEPTATATGIPDAIGDDYREELALGALARLLAMNKTEWTNPALAQQKAEEFAARVARIKTRVWRSFSNTRPRSRGQFF